MFSEDLIAGIKEREGLRPRYWDHKQWSIGHGTRWTPGMPTTLTPEQADSALRDELAKARGYVVQRFPGLDNRAVEGLSSFTYNLGPGWMKGTNLAAAIDAGDTEGARKIMLQYNKASGVVQPGLVKRRLWEASYLGGPTDAAATATPAAVEGENKMPAARQVNMQAPADPSVMQRVIQLGSDSQRAKDGAKLLNNIAYQQTPVGSNFEGMSRVIAAIGGGLQSNAARSAEEERRSALVGLLGGKDSLSPMEQYAFASGDPQLASAALSRRLAAENKTPEYAFAPDGTLINKATGQPVSAKGAYAKPEKPEQPKLQVARDGTVVDLRTGQAVGEKGQFAPPPTTKQTEFRKLSDQQQKLIEQSASAHSLITNSQASFKDEYGGSGILGETANWLARNTPLSNETMRDRASWWQTYDSYANQVRHGLFGSALTKGEQDAWEKATITPNMQPEMIKRNLKTQRDIMEGAQKRRAAVLKAEGYNPESITAGYGRTAEDLGLAPAAAASGSATATPAPGGAAPAATQAAAPASLPSDIPSDVQNALRSGKTVEGPDGKRYKLGASGLEEVK